MLNRKIIFLVLNQNICCGYWKEPSQNWWVRKFYNFKLKIWYLNLCLISLNGYLGGNMEFSKQHLLSKFKSYYSEIDGRQWYNAPKFRIIAKCYVIWQSRSRPQLSVRNRKLFTYFSTKTYVVGTQKNPLNEMVLLSTQNTHSNWWVRK